MPISNSQTDSNQFVTENTTNEDFEDINSAGEVDALDETTETETETETTTTADAYYTAADEIQMDINGDGIVDATGSGDSQRPE